MNNKDLRQVRKGDIVINLSCKTKTLTIGKEYVVYNEYGKFFQIKNDNNTVKFYSKNRSLFEIKKDAIKLEAKYILFELNTDTGIWEWNILSDTKQECIDDLNEMESNGEHDCDYRIFDIKKVYVK